MPTKTAQNVKPQDIQSDDAKTQSVLNFLGYLADEGGAILNLSDLPLNPEETIAVAEYRVRNRIAKFKSDGLLQSAKNLAHYLDGGGKDLIVKAAEYRAIPFIRKSESELMKRWERAVIGDKPYDGESLYQTFSDIAKARGNGAAESQTEIDWFQVNISLADSLNISQDFSLSWGKSHFRARAADGLSIRIGGDLVVVRGKITFGSIDAYDFNFGQPGSFDGRSLESARIAKKYWMITKWERDFEASVELTKAKARSWQQGRSPIERGTIVYRWSEPVLDGPLTGSQDYRKLKE